MSKHAKILKRPVITEKIDNLTETQHKYAFEVDKKANKIEIKTAVQKRFNVEVTSVRTMNVQGKIKRLGKFQGPRASWKKALVTLKEGQKIDYFENI